MAQCSEIKCLTDKPALCGECPIWDGSKEILYWTDISGKQMHVCKLDSLEISSYRMPGRVGSFALCESGGLVAGMESKFVKLDENMIHYELAETDIFESPEHRLNDGKADRFGRFFWAGSMDLTRKLGNAGLWRFGADGSVVKILDGLHTSNGLAWSPDGKLMYHTDSFMQTLWVSDYCTDTGSISNRRVLRKFSDSEGRPDGATVDSAGYYWTAMYRGAKIMRLAPNGQTDRIIELPVICPTMCAFGGGDLKTLYITSASENLSPVELKEYPLSGHLLSIELEIRGLPEPRFAV